MFRKANMGDIDRISEIYNEIHREVEKGDRVTGWIRDTYPTRKTAEDAVDRGDMFVGEDKNGIFGAAIINQIQGKEYVDVKWQYEAPDSEIMVLHTIVVSPRTKGKGYGPKFIKFYEDYALENGCSYLRMDTNEGNSYARGLYKSLGYREAGIIECLFNGIPGVRLVFLEKKL